jgi:hypothetical protein
LLTVNAIKDKADRLKNPKSRLHRKFKVLQMNLFSQIILKLFNAGGLKPRDVPSGTAILVSAVRHRYGQTYNSILFVRTECKGDT